MSERDEADEETNSISGSEVEAEAYGGTSQRKKPFNLVIERADSPDDEASGTGSEVTQSNAYADYEDTETPRASHYHNTNMTLTNRINDNI